MTGLFLPVTPNIGRNTKKIKIRIFSRDRVSGKFPGIKEFISNKISKPLFICRMPVPGKIRNGLCRNHFPFSKQYLRGSPSLPQWGRPPTDDEAPLTPRRIKIFQLSFPCTGLLHGASPDEAASTRGPLSNKIQDLTYGFPQSQEMVF